MIEAEIVGSTLHLRIPMKLVWVLEQPGQFEAPLRFTGREQQYFQALLEGKQHKEIADEMCVSIQTAKNAARTIYRKCGVRDKVQLIQKFSKQESSNGNHHDQPGGEKPRVLGDRADRDSGSVVESLPLQRAAGCKP